MATLSVPQKPVAAAVQAALPLAAESAPEVKNDLIALAPTPQLNPRAQIMADIAARSNAQADVDAAETIQATDENGDIAPVATQTASETPVEGEDEPSTPVEADTPETPPAAPIEAAKPTFDPDAEYDLTVDGKVIKVKGAQIIERGKMHIQKETAADYKLELASRLLQEAQARSAPPPAPAPAAVQQLSDEQLAEMIQFGTKEQAAQAITLLKGNANSATANEGVQRAMAEKLPQVVRDQIAFQEGVQFVQGEYADLLADPYLKPLFFMKENQMRQAGDTRGYKDMYRQIGEELRTHFNRPKTTSAAPAAAPQTREEKVAAKSAAPAAPRLASARLEGAAPVKAPTREDVIAKMQRSRGQSMPTTH